MAMVGVGNLTPQEAARRAENWFGARVDTGSCGKIKIYPKDPAQPMIVISDRWLNGNDRRNAVSRLQRAGLDVINGQTPPDSPIRSDGRSIDKHLTQKIEISTDTERTPDVTTVEPARNGHPTPAAMPAKPAASGDYQALLGMLAEAEKNDQARRAEIGDLRQTVEVLAGKVERHELALAQGRAANARLVKMVKESEQRLMAVTAAPQTEAERAEAERAELTAKAITLLESLPPAATMAAGSIAASLGMPEKGNLLGKLMAVAAREGEVSLLKVGAQKLYRSVPKDET